MLSWILMKKLIFHNPQQKNLISYLLQLLNIRNFFLHVLISISILYKKLWTSMQWKCIFAINCWKGKVHNNKHTTFFRFSNIHTTKNSHIWFLTIFLRLTGISKNFRQLEEVFSSLMHQLCRKHQKLTTTNFLLNRSSLTTFFLVIHPQPHFSFIFGAKTSLS